MKVLSFLIVCSLFLVSGCSTVSSAQSSKGKGTAKVYSAPFEPVWQAVTEVVPSLGLKVVSENKGTGEVLAQGSISAFSWGENVAIFVSKENTQASTKVEVVSKRALATNITAKNWEPTILEALDKKLASSGSKKVKAP